MYVLLVGSPILILTPEERLKSHQNHRVCIYMYLQINIFPLKVAIHKNMKLHLKKKIGKDKKKKKSIKVKNFYKLTQVKDIICNAFKCITSSCVFFG